MFKQVVSPATEAKPARSRISPPRIIAILVTLALLAPLAAEGAATCYAQWSTLMGKNHEVPTPIIDAIGSGLDRAGELFSDHVGSPLDHAIHDVNFVFPVGALLLVFAMALLKR
jgi:hypothetical protein